MNANELADWCDEASQEYGNRPLVQIATMLRQQQAEYYSLLVNHDKLYAKVVEQQAEIEALKDIVERFISEWKDDFKNYKYNSDEPEENKLRDDVFAILRKAQKND